MDFIENNKEACKFLASQSKKITVFHLVLKHWDVREDIFSTLRPAYDFTIASQHSQYTLSDPYLGWIKVERKLTASQKVAHETDFAQIFYESLK